MKFLSLSLTLLAAGLMSNASAGRVVDVLHGDEHLMPGDTLQSKTGWYLLKVKDDGSIAMYNNTSYPGREYWNPGVFGQELLYQYDGNLVLYDTGRQHAIWTVNKGISQNTWGSLIVTERGALQASDVYGKVLWKTDDDPGYKAPGTSCPGGAQSQLYPICVAGMSFSIPACSTQDAANYAHQQGGNYGACH